MVVAVATALALPSLAQAGPPGWSAPTAVTPAGEDLLGFGDVVIDDTGTATYVWVARQGNGSILRAARCTATACSAAQDVSSAGFSIREVAATLAPDGAIVVAWVQRQNLDDSLHARVYQDGAWGQGGAVFQAAGRNPFDLDVIAFSGDLAAYSFRSFSGGVSVASVVTCAGYNALCSTADVSGVNTVTAVRMASNGRNRGVLVYSQSALLQRDVQSVALQANANGSVDVGAAQPIAAPSADTQANLSVAMDTSGTVTAAWSEVSLLNPIFVQRYSVLQPPGAVALLPAAAGSESVQFASMSTDVAADGTATVLWGVSDGANQIVRSLTYVDNATEGWKQVVPAAQGGSIIPAAAGAADGRVVVAVDAGERVRTKVRSDAAGPWANRFTRRQAGATNVADLRLAANASGRTALLWRATIGGTDRYYASQLGPDVTITATRPRLRRNAITTRVRATAAGRVIQVGRYKKGRRNVLACRTRVVRVTANRTRTARCVLTGVALRDRRAGRRPTITITTTLRPASGQRVRAATTYRMPRRR